MLENVWPVAEFIDGTQHNLFLDPEVFQSGSRQFLTKSTLGYPPLR